MPAGGQLAQRALCSHWAANGLLRIMTGWIYRHSPCLSLMTTIVSASQLLSLKPLSRSLPCLWNAGPLNYFIKTNRFIYLLKINVFKSGPPNSLVNGNLVTHTMNGRKP